MAGLGNGAACEDSCKTITMYVPVFILIICVNGPKISFFSLINVSNFIFRNGCHGKRSMIWFILMVESNLT